MRPRAIPTICLRCRNWCPAKRPQVQWNRRKKDELAGLSGAPTERLVDRYVLVLRTRPGGRIVMGNLISKEPTWSRSF